MTALFPYHAETAGVMVRVAVAYLADQSSPAARRWFWSYHIRIENRREDTVQLLARHWVIKDMTGFVHEVRGEGVVGDTPSIERGASYDYVSGCPLETPAGVMAGTFHMVDEQGSPFDIEIPAFELATPD
ncbi:MAG: Co2+/Mg2+ efflux protein ApaG [Pseudomonadota bacterium]|nr:Co2+/Mg2+ efflux protein ApaG [Pseudomonadota bacterium]